MDDNSVAGPDGYNGYFYKHCWDIKKEDLHAVVCEFFAGFELPKSWTSTLLVPIPKNVAPVSFSQYRPISLCNFANKMISKLLATRLTGITLISKEQSGFVKGRNIQDNILLAQKMIHELKRKVRGSNVAVKLDMKKAYDSVC